MLIIAGEASALANSGESRGRPLRFGRCLEDGMRMTSKREGRRPAIDETKDRSRGRAPNDRDSGGEGTSLGRGGSAEKRKERLKIEGGKKKLK